MESNRLASATLDERARLEGRLAEAERRIAAIIGAIEDGLYEPSMKARMAALEADKAEAAAKLADLGEAKAVPLHPNLPALYRKKVEEFQQLLADPELSAEAMEAIRSLIARIILTPRPEGWLAAELYGDLARILAIVEAGTHKNQRPGRNGPGRGLSVVAGTRNTLCLLLFSTRRIGRR